jgi:hypothetical protein
MDILRQLHSPGEGIHHPPSPNLFGKISQSNLARFELEKND